MLEEFLENKYLIQPWREGRYNPRSFCCYYSKQDHLILSWTLVATSLINSFYGKVILSKGDNMIVQEWGDE